MNYFQAIDLMEDWESSELEKKQKLVSEQQKFYFLRLLIDASKLKISKKKARKKVEANFAVTSKPKKKKGI